MIKGFKNKKTEDLFHGVKSRHVSKLPKDLQKAAHRKLDMLNAVTKVESLKVPPGNRLEQLKGDLKGYWSIRINDQYRLIFEWQDGDAYNVYIDDYH